MDFGKALEALKAEKKVYRTGWNKKREFLVQVVPGRDLTFNDGLGLIANRIAANRYIAIKTEDNHFAPWAARQVDMLAEDWRVMKEVTEPISDDEMKSFIELGKDMQRNGAHVEIDPEYFSRIMREVEDNRAKEQATGKCD